MPGRGGWRPALGFHNPFFTARIADTPSTGGPLRLVAFGCMILVAPTLRPRFDSRETAPDAWNLGSVPG